MYICHVGRLEQHHIKNMLPTMWPQNPDNEQVDSSLSKNQALIRKLNLLQLTYKHKIWILRKAYAFNLL